MPKTTWKPGTMIYPLPAVMVSCGTKPEDFNIITISWTGTICSDPPMCYISVRKNRHSYKILKDAGEFVINLTTQKLAKATDWCGVRSGSKYSKFSEMNLTPVPAPNVKAPMILESPVNIECRVFEIKELGTHDMFLAHVIAVHADNRLIDAKTGAFDLAKANPIAYSHGQYFQLGKPIGKFGWSVEKKKTKTKKTEK
jgi:flavin reductase (DIM6/NTAB) family NADH-FMN oxidoreductase RutF